MPWVCWAVVVLHLVSLPPLAVVVLEKTIGELVGWQLVSGFVGHQVVSVLEQEVAESSERILA